MSIKASELKAKVSALGVDSTVADLTRIGNEFDKLGSRVGAMNGTLHESQGAWSQFKDTLNGTKLTPPTDAAPGLKAVGDEFEKLGKKAKGAAGDLKESQSAWARFKGDFTSGFNFSAGLMAFDALKTGLTSVGSLALDASTGYESAMNLLEASSSASADEMTALAKVAKQLGGDITLPGTSAADAAGAMLELNKAGLSLTDTMDAAKGVLQLSAAAQVENAQAAVMVGDALNTFGLNGREATRVADLLAGASLAASGEIGDMSSALQQVGAVAASAKIPIETTVALISELAKNGIKGSDAGTSTKTFIQRLQSQTAEARAEIEKLGVSIYDSQGAMLPMGSIIDQFSTSLSGLSEQQRANAMNTIFGSDAVRAATIFFKEGSTGLETMTGAVTRQGSAAAMAEAQTKGFKGAMEGLKSAVETLAVEGLTPILPLLSSAITAFATLLGPVGAVANFIGNNFVPNLAGVGTALGAYALSAAAATAGTGLLSLSLQVAALNALEAAASMALAALPFVAIAAAVGTTILVLNKFTDSATEQSKAILKNRDAYNDAKTALENYASVATTLEGNPALDAEAQKLKELTTLYEEKFKRATGDGTLNWFAAAFDSGDVTNRQVAELKELEQQMAAVRAEMEKQKSIAMFDSKAMDGAVADFNALEAAADGYTVSAQDAFVVTEEAAKKAEKELERLAEAGPGAYDALIQSAVSFESAREAALAEHNTKMDQLRKDGNLKGQLQEEIAYRAQEQTAASSYVQQQAAQRAHLGQMLIDWINAQAMTNQAFAAKSGELVTMISGQYGIVASAGDVAWGKNLNAIRGYVDGAIPTMGALSSTLNANTEAAISNRQAAEGLNAKYTTEIEQKWAAGAYGVGPEAVAAYRRDLDSVQVRVDTEIAADASNAVAQVEKAQDQYARMERKIESEIIADPADALLAAADVRNEYEKVPAKVTTVLHADGTAVRGEATAAGQEAGAGFAAGIAASAAQAAAAARNMAGGAIAAARLALESRSPSRVFASIGGDTTSGFALGIESTSSGPQAAIQRMTSAMVSQARSSQPAMAETGRQSNNALITGVQSTMALVKVAGHLTGQTLNIAVGAGIESTHTIPRDKLKKSVGDVAAAYRDFTIKQEEANRQHATKLSGIWDDYYRTLKEKTDEFNGDKFDQQMGFYERVADMDAMQRAAALEQQQSAWETSQQMAQEGRAVEAAAYYEAALKEIEANQQRADRIAGIDEDIAAKKKELVDASTEEQQAALAAEIAELESRKTYLEQLDAQQDQMAAEKLEALKTANSSLAEERDTALGEENSAYKQAQDKLAQDFGSAVDGILNHEDRMLAAHVAFANSLINSYEGAADAARRAAASLPSGGSGGNESGGEGGDPPVDGSHALGLKYVPFDGYIAELHKGEEVKTAEEAEADRRAKQFARVGQLASSTATAIGSSSSPTTTTKANADDREVHIHFDGDVYIQNDMDIKELSYQVAKEFKKQRGT